MLATLSLAVIAVLFVISVRQTPEYRRWRMFKEIKRQLRRNVKGLGSYDPWVR